MAIKVYISGISGNKEVKKRQQRVLMILDSKNVKYEVVDIAEPGNEEAKEFMQINSKCLGATIGDANPKYPLPPQLFNDDEYCGDYDQFDLSNEIDEIEKFLKLPYEESSVTSTAQVKIGNGDSRAESLTNGNEAEAKQQNDDTSLSDKPVEDTEVTSSSEDQQKLNEDENKEKEDESEKNDGAGEKVDEEKNEKEDEENAKKEDGAEEIVEKESDSEEKVEKDDNSEKKVENKGDSEEKVEKRDSSEEKEAESDKKVDAEEKDESDEDSEDKSTVDTKDA